MSRPGFFETAASYERLDFIGERLLAAVKAGADRVPFPLTGVNDGDRGLIRNFIGELWGA